MRAFLSHVEQELVQVLNEKAALENEVGRLRDRIEDQAVRRALVRRRAPRSRTRDRYLLTFSDVYRTHLRTYLEALLRNVEEWETSERDSLATTRSTLPRMD